jgi:hypothetical protein
MRVTLPNVTIPTVSSPSTNAVTGAAKRIITAQNIHPNNRFTQNDDETMSFFTAFFLPTSNPTSEVTSNASAVVKKACKLDSQTTNHEMTHPNK